jgi:hypothetical protein
MKKMPQNDWSNLHRRPDSFKTSLATAHHLATKSAVVLSIEEGELRATISTVSHLFIINPSAFADSDGLVIRNRHGPSSNLLKLFCSLKDGILGLEQ